MLSRIHHKFEFNIGRGELTIVQDIASGMPKFRFEFIPSGDIYFGMFYEHGGCINPSYKYLEYMFRIEPVMSQTSSAPVVHEIANGAIDMVFMENFHSYENITVRLFKLPISEAAAEIRNNLAADAIIIIF